MNDKKRNSILIVDDQRSNIDALREILSPDYRIYVASSGNDALKVVDEFMPDIILLDIIMPGLDGFAVISALKSSEKTSSIPVIFITGRDSQEAEAKGLSLGAADYIARPFHAPIVKLRVQNQINNLERSAIEKANLNIVLQLQAELVAAKELSEHNRQVAEHANRAKSEFLSRMSHEMKTPMNAIMGMLQIIKMRGVPDNISSYIEEISYSSNDLLELINDVLDITDIEYGTFSLSESAFDLTVAIQEIVKAANHNIAAKMQNFTSNIDNRIPPTLLGDERHFKRVVSNLIANAVKFTPESGDIRLDVSASHESDDMITLKVDVTDNGIGVAQEHHEIIFDLFEQVDGSSTRKHGGIGLGLPLSKSIAIMMGGDIHIESKLGEGAKFTFTCVFRKQ